MDARPAIIETAATPEQARRVYDLWSHFYGWTAPLFERRPQMLALEKADIQPHDKVLEVAVGPGGILLEIARRTNVVCGIDMSPKMLAKARRLVTKAGYGSAISNSKRPMHGACPSRTTPSTSSSTATCSICCR